MGCQEQQLGYLEAVSNSRVFGRRTVIQENQRQQSVGQAVPVASGELHDRFSVSGIVGLNYGGDILSLGHRARQADGRVGQGRMNLEQSSKAPASPAW
jgi:hypothetical protein